MPEQDTPTPRHAPDRSRYEIDLDGETVGFAAYVDHDGRRVFFHTVVDERFGGRGLAGQVVGHALADTRAAGLRIVAMCPYVARYVTTHHEVDDVLEPVTTADRAAVRDAADGPGTTS